MTGPSVPEQQLRAVVRYLIDHGQLPVMRADHLAAGYGSGDGCAVCSLEITGGQVDYEVRLEGREPWHFHITCFSAWQLECAARLRVAGGPHSPPGSDGDSKGNDGAGPGPGDDQQAASLPAWLQGSLAGAGTSPSAASNRPSEGAGRTTAALLDGVKQL